LGFATEEAIESAFRPCKEDQKVKNHPVRQAKKQMPKQNTPFYIQTYLVFGKQNYS